VRRFIPIWLVIIVFIATAIYLPGVSKYLKLKEKERDLDLQIQTLEAQIEEMRAEEHLIKTDLARLEEVVRKELGLVKPGEIVYKVVEEEVE
jgi:cell division protein FtsB